MKRIPCILILYILSVFPSCKEGDKDGEKEVIPSEQQKAAIVTELAKDNDMSAFLAQFESLDVSDWNAEALTVFAVSNSATGNFTADVVKRHVVKGLVTREQLVDGVKLTSADNATLDIDVVGKTIYVNSVPVGNEIKAGNSIVYILTRIIPAENTKTLEQQKLIISELRKSENLQAFADRFEALDLSEIDTDAFTVFAVEEEETSEPGVQSLTDDEIKRHIVKGIWTAESLTDGVTLKTINDTELSVTVYNENKFLNGVLLWEDVPKIKRNSASIGSNILSVVTSVFPLKTPVKFTVDFQFVRWGGSGGTFFQEPGRFGYHAHSVSAHYRITYSVNGNKTSHDTLVRAHSPSTIVYFGERSNREESDVGHIYGEICTLTFMAGSLTFPSSFQQWGWRKVNYSERKADEVKLEDGRIRKVYMVDISAYHTNVYGHFYSYPIYRYK